MRRSPSLPSLALAALAALLAGAAPAACTHPPDPPAPVVSAPPPPPRVDVAPPAALPLPAPPSAEPPLSPASSLPYPWLADPAAPTPDGTLLARFSPPPGYARAPLPPDTYGAWLRSHPLSPADTPVRGFRGQVILPADHPHLAAVAALAVGDKDLQQCADSVIRLHAEWLFASGRRDQSYRAASGTPMPFARWANGERMVPDGMAFAWTFSARPDNGRAAFRRWLDGVFAFANTGSLARDTEPVALDDLRPGDFVVQAGAPGHTVLVLDMAVQGARRALLLGQGYMPAQSFHVLRPGGGEGAAEAWFVVEPGALALDTPFWAPFPWKALRRFPGT